MQHFERVTIDSSPKNRIGGQSLIGGMIAKIAAGGAVLFYVLFLYHRIITIETETDGRHSEGQTPTVKGILVLLLITTGIVAGYSLALWRTIGIGSALGMLSGYIYNLTIKPFDRLRPARTNVTERAIATAAEIFANLLAAVVLPLLILFFAYIGDSGIFGLAANIWAPPLFVLASVSLVNLSLASADIYYSDKSLGDVVHIHIP